MNERVELAVCVAHPDDECLIAGAWMSGCVAEGHRVEVFIATAGEGASHPTLSAAALGQQRLHESKVALGMLGVSQPSSPRLPDGKLSEFESELKDALEAWLSEHRPKQVVTYGLDGGYGHVDHVAVTKALIEINRANRFELHQAVFAEHTFVDLRRFLKRSSPELLSSEALEVKAPPPTLILRDPGLLMKKRAALEKYESQLQERSVDAFLGTKAMTHILDYEQFAPLTG